MKEISQPGRYSGVRSADYHADPCPAPSLSSHVAVTLIEQSPRHAWRDHPRLNPDFKRTHKKEFDIGIVAHALMLGDPECKIEIVKAKNWITKAARFARDQAYEKGHTPLLQEQADRVAAMVNAGQLQLQASEWPNAFTDGKPEETLVWLEQTLYGHIWCRCRPDWFPNYGSVFPDYKTTGGSASSDAFYSAAWDRGYYFQEAFYRRGIEAATGIRPTEFRFVFQEVEDPYALTINALSPIGTAEAEECVQEAIDLWAYCLHKETWPGFSGRVAYVDPPPWVLRRREARKDREELLRTHNVGLYQDLLRWDAP